MICITAMTVYIYSQLANRQVYRVQIPEGLPAVEDEKIALGLSFCQLYALYFEDKSSTPQDSLLYYHLSLSLLGIFPGYICDISNMVGLSWPMIGGLNRSNLRQRLRMTSPTSEWAVRRCMQTVEDIFLYPFCT